MGTLFFLAPNFLLPWRAIQHNECPIHNCSLQKIPYCWGAFQKAYFERCNERSGFFPFFVFGESHTSSLSSPLFLSLPTPMARENWPPRPDEEEEASCCSPIRLLGWGEREKGKGGGKARLGPSDWRPDWVGWRTGARKGGREKEDHPMFFHVGVC